MNCVALGHVLCLPLLGRLDGALSLSMGLNGLPSLNDMERDLGVWVLAFSGWGSELERYVWD
jgi:hypothetical protein